MHLLNTVCSHLVSQKNVAVGTLDKKLSSLFDDEVTSTVPAQAFEQLFGAHRYDVDSECRHCCWAFVHNGCVALRCVLRYATETTQHAARCRTATQRARCEHPIISPAHAATHRIRCERTLTNFLALGAVYRFFNAY